MLTRLNSDDLDSPHDDHLQPSNFSKPITKYPSSSKSSETEYDLPPGILALIQPHITSVTAQKFTSHKGKVYELPKKAPKFTKPLGNKILVLDVESRNISGLGGLLDDGKPTTDELQGLTLGRLNHYLFGKHIYQLWLSTTTDLSTAKLHGYDYQIAQLPDDPNLHGTWNKVPAMLKAIKQYEYVFFLDGDAIIMHPHLPLEWLLNYWDISGNATIALAEDPKKFLNGKGLYPNLNTGVIIAHYTPGSDEFFDAWMTCPDETRYEGCGVWKLRHTHEQAVINEYLRYDYREEIQILSCTEANRYPNDDDECSGEFISHFWPFKELLTGAVKETMAQYFWPTLQQTLSHDRENIIKAFSVNGLGVEQAKPENKSEAGELLTN
jgi:hypothetical protein